MKIIKSLGKKITLKIDETGELIVRSPAFVSKKKVQEFIEKNKEWIAEKKDEAIEKIKEFREWEKFYFFWQEYELVFDDVSEDIYYDGMKLYLHKRHKVVIKEKLIEFYKKEAKKYIVPRVREIASKNWLDYNIVKITSAKSRWGSCTNKKNLNFTYRLIMAPTRSIDYVIIHELAHLKHMDHSKKFWDYVQELSSSMYPWSYKINEQWLKQNGSKIMY